MFVWCNPGNFFEQTLFYLNLFFPKLKVNKFGMHDRCPISGCIAAFKSVREIRLNIADETFADVSAFDELFFGDLARRDVRSLEVRTTYDAIEVDVATALAFGFAEPAAGGDRRLEGVELNADSNVLATVREVMSDNYLSKVAQIGPTR